MITRMCLAAIVVIVASCDQRRCNVDADCVTGETCSNGACVAEGEGEGSVGEGEGNVGEGEGIVGEGEGEGANAGSVCDGVVCGTATVCVDVAAAPDAGTCAPPAGTVFECPNVLGGGEAAPLANGPVIWHASAVSDIGTDCGANQTRVGGSFRFYDPVGTTTFTGHSLIVVRNDEDGNNYFPDATPTYDDPAHPGKSGTVSYSGCVPTLATEILIELDDDDTGSSNTLCVTR